ncbi:hypothetical protein [Duganella levis]|uniref:Uncharacterized protein n=1 Tax=Duganella levis TaxID=2692169 RepID=A0ABW9W3I5_9BURK|nr:hypothetical protein [Duganella levis]MYN28489.1 hypothetical protein [Duganella levis]
MSNRFFRQLTVLMTFAIATAVQAQAPVPAPSPAAPAAPALHVITGFRSAHFGMTEAEVRQAVQHDFPADAAGLRAFDNPTERTRVLAVGLLKLEPGPASAAVSYIFGATSHQLIQVNVVWTTGEQPSEQERAQIAAAGFQLTSYFRELTWEPGHTGSGASRAPGVLTLFTGVDSKNAVVEVRLSGVAVGKAAQPAGPTQLRLAYAAKAGQPDVAPAPKPGSF